jgi:hypothetical protein
MQEQGEEEEEDAVFKVPTWSESLSLQTSAKNTS